MTVTVIVLVVVLPHLSVADTFTLYVPGVDVFTLEESILAVNVVPSQSLADALIKELEKLAP